MLTVPTQKSVHQPACLLGLFTVHSVYKIVRTWKNKYISFIYRYLLVSVLKLVVVKSYLCMCFLFQQRQQNSTESIAMEQGENSTKISVVSYLWQQSWSASILVYFILWSNVMTLIITHGMVEHSSVNESMDKRGGLGTIIKVSIPLVLHSCGHHDILFLSVPVFKSNDWLVWVKEDS